MQRPEGLRGLGEPRGWEAEAAEAGCVPLCLPMPQVGVTAAPPSPEASWDHWSQREPSFLPVPQSPHRAEALPALGLGHLAGVRVTQPGQGLASSGLHPAAPRWTRRLLPGSRVGAVAPGSPKDVSEIQGEGRGRVRLPNHQKDLPQRQGASCWLPSTLPPSPPDARSQGLSGRSFQHELPAPFPSPAGPWPVTLP